VRKALGREDIWGVRLPMSASASDTDDELLQFELAYGTPWLGIDRRLRIDEPAVRTGIIEALNAYTSIWRKGCTPPDSTAERHRWPAARDRRSDASRRGLQGRRTLCACP
jgi:multiple sugar transport system substrate-binding protein